MDNYITVDGGTTNTRICLVKDRTIVESMEFCVGAKTGIDDDGLLKKILKDAVSEILEKNNMQESQIEAILASGMITSEFGLVMLDHIAAPAGIKELHNAMEKVLLSDISNIPFVFVRGVKIVSPYVEKVDMMRGEETELIGIMEENEGECLYVLPGSHTKIIRTDKDGRIAEFSTMLTGEMVQALAQNTILKDAVSLENIIFNKDYLMRGYHYACENGINEALFKVRVMKNIFKCTKEEIYSFFIGIILCGEAEKILKYNPRKIVIGGKKQLREALGILLCEKTTAKVVCVCDEKVNSSASIGMIKIYEYSKKV